MEQFQLKLELMDLYSSVRIMGLDYTFEKSGWRYPTHRHRYFELIYCINGMWEQTIGQKVYDLKPGEAILVKSDFPHSTALHSDCSYFGFHFRLEDMEIQNFFQSVANPLILPSKSTMLLQKFIDTYGGYWTEERTRLISDPMHKIDFAIEKMGMIAELLKIISELANYFIRMEDSEDEEGARMKPAQIKVAHELSFMLESKIHDKMQFQEMADELKYNRSYLSHCFKQVYGMTPKEYFTRLKIRRAKELLQETDWSMVRISEELAFASQQHFSLAFRRITNLSPLQFRKQL